jgi:hypothetical protein
MEGVVRVEWVGGLDDVCLQGRQNVRQSEAPLKTTGGAQSLGKKCHDILRR